MRDEASISLTATGPGPNHVFVFAIGLPNHVKASLPSGSHIEPRAVQGTLWLLGLGILSLTGITSDGQLSTRVGI